MTAPTYLDYCYGEEMEIDSFCRLPRIFVTNEFYCTVPAEIKILYGLMLDRVAMSMRNNWREDARRIAGTFSPLNYHMIPAVFSSKYATAAFSFCSMAISTARIAV